MMVDVHVQLHHLIHVEGLNAAASGHANGVAHEMQGVVVLDLSEVTLVDRDAVNLIAMCALKNVELRNCPAFLREWVTKERQRMDAGTVNKAPGATGDIEDT